MRKAFVAITTSLIGIGLMAGVASASSVTCSISNTGPGSTNAANCVDTNNISVSCSNQGTIVQSNNQNATSGSATTSGNTSSGGASSGNSSNSNSVTVQLGASCAPVAGQASAFTTSAVVTPSKSTPTASTSKSTTTPTSLPTTGSNTALDVAIAGVGGLAGVSLLSASALAVKRHLSK